MEFIPSLPPSLPLPPPQINLKNKKTSLNTKECILKKSYQCLDHSTKLYTCTSRPFPPFSLKKAAHSADFLHDAVFRRMWKIVLWQHKKIAFPFFAAWSCIGHLWPFLLPGPLLVFWCSKPALSDRSQTDCRAILSFLVA